MYFEVSDLDLQLIEISIAPVIEICGFTLSEALLLVVLHEKKIHINCT